MEKYTGYLKVVSQRLEVDTIYLKMMIPNEEVKYIYRNSIKEWFEEKLKDTNLEKLYNAVLEGD